MTRTASPACDGVKIGIEDISKMCLEAHELRLEIELPGAYRGIRMIVLRKWARIRSLVVRIL